MTLGHLGRLALAIAIAGLLQFVTFGPAAAAPNLAGGCDTTASKFKVYTSSPQTTNSSNYSDIVGTNVSFRQGGTAAGCVIVTFASEAMVSTGGQMVVRALLETDALCGPADVSFVPVSNAMSNLGAQSMTFVCTNVAPGNHTVRVQYHITGMVSGTVGARSTVVQYLK